MDNLIENAKDVTQNNAVVIIIIDILFINVKYISNKVIDYTSKNDVL